MNELVMKEVDFLGDTLVAVQDNQNNIYVGVRWICDGIGLSEGQRKRQISNIQSDLILSKGVSKLILPTNGGNQEVVCLLLDYIPLWLAKINITPTMIHENPNLVTKLIQYQLKCKDVLANAFLVQNKLPQTYKEALQQLLIQVEKNEKLTDTIAVQNQQIAEMKPKASYYDIVLNCKDLISTSAIAKDYGKSAVWMNRYLHEKGIQFKQGDIWFLYQKYAEKGYTSTKTLNYLSSDGKVHNKVHTYWTQKGRLFIYDLMKSDGMLPLIEREILMK